MYAKNKNNVTFFVDSYNENTDKVTYLMVMDFDLQEDNK